MKKGLFLKICIGLLLLLPFVFAQPTTEIIDYYPLNESWVNNELQEISIETNNTSECHYSTNGSKDWEQKENMSKNDYYYNASVELLEGKNSIYIQCSDLQDNVMEDKFVYVLNLDTNPPAQGEVVINNFEKYTSAETLNVSWKNFSDNASGISHYYYGYSNKSGETVDRNTSQQSATITNNNEGNITVYVWAEDYAGNIGHASSDWIIADFTSPLFVNWSNNPKNLSFNYTGDFTIDVEIHDDNLLKNPECRNKIGDNEYSTWEHMDIISENRFTITISAEWNKHAGEYLTYQCNATDKAGNFRVETHEKYISEDKNPPRIINLEDMQVYQNQNLSFILEGEEIRNRSLTFSTSNENISIEKISHNMSRAQWIPTYLDVGENEINFSVTNGISKTTETITIYVTWVNDPPQLNEINDINAYLHKPFTKIITATDLDNKIDGRDNQFGYFSTNVSWLREGEEIRSSFNYTSREYVGFLNFTPLMSHKGEHTVNFKVTDEEGATDSQNVSILVGYCGDGICQAEYEDCDTCPEDCGRCRLETTKRMAIKTQDRNCLYTNTTISVYNLFERATCPTEGSIVDGKEVCEPIEGTTISIYRLKEEEWERHGRYLTGEEGKVSFYLKKPGQYRIIGEHHDYKEGKDYMEVRECVDISPGKEEDGFNESTEKSNRTEDTKNNDTLKEDIPGQIDNNKDEKGRLEKATFAITLIYYIIIPTLIISLLVAVCLFYQKEKNNRTWILRGRIWLIKREKIIKNYLKRYYIRIKDISGFVK